MKSLLDSPGCEGGVKAAALKLAMKKASPRFDHAELGYLKFRSFLEYARDRGVVNLEVRANGDDIVSLPLSNPPTGEHLAVGLPSPAAKLDANLALLAAGDKNDAALVAFAEATLALAGVGDEFTAPCTDPIGLLISNAIPRPARPLCAAALVRLLHAQGGSIDPRAFQRMDVELPELYAKLRINAKQQSYVKRQSLHDAMCKAHDAYSAAADQVRLLTDIPKAKAALYPVLNSQSARFLICPFLPPEFQYPFQSLSDAIAAFCEYMQGEPDKVGILLRDALASAHAIAVRANAYGGRYALDIARITKRMAELVQSHFDASPSGKPATLKVRGTDKRYPLLESGCSLAITIELENIGPGYAFDTAVELFDSEALALERDSVRIGSIVPGVVALEFPARVIVPRSSAQLRGKISWRSANGSPSDAAFNVAIEGQKAQIDWTRLSQRNPYHLEPVRHAGEFVGWVGIVDDLLANVTADKPGSSFVYGQKRLGKTSLVKTVASHLSQGSYESWCPVYLEAGDYVAATPTRTVERLTRRVFDTVRASAPSLASLEPPEADSDFDSLAPLGTFFERVQRVAPGQRFIVILDEFDEIPPELYASDRTSRPFFLSLRALSGRTNVGIILVGGERMREVLSRQSSHLNKFIPVAVQAFTKEQHWNDFCELVRRPVAGDLEYTDASLVRLWDYAAGHPYYTRMVCARLYKMMVSRRDAHVMPRDVDRAAEETASEAEINSFAHYWEDGIVDTLPDQRSAEMIQSTRRKLLLAAGHLLRTKCELTERAVVEGAVALGVSPASADAQVKQFVERRVMVARDARLEFAVPLFARWLRGKGCDRLVTQFHQADVELSRWKAEAEAYVQPEEVVDLASGWGTYQGQQISEDRVRAWLNQFGDNSAQRAMFAMLKGLRFYNGARIREKLREGHTVVQRAVVRPSVASRLHPTTSTGKKRRDLVVTHGGGLGKSGASFARLYAQENGIYNDRVVERAKLGSLMQTHDGEINAVICVDDFVGTGGSAEAGLREVIEIVKASHLTCRVFFIAVAGFTSAGETVERTLADRDVEVKIVIADGLGAADKCFSEANAIWPDKATMQHARELCAEHGDRLVPAARFGFGDTEALVVFEGNCPNNVPAVFWSDKKGWTPLFPRPFA